MKSEIKEIKQIKIMTVAKVLLVVGVILGILMGINLAIGARATIAQYPEMATMTFADMTLQLQDAGYNIQQVSQAYASLLLIRLGYWNLILMPIAFGALYFLAGIIGAFIYNLIARYIGGIKVVLN